MALEKLGQSTTRSVQGEILFQLLQEYVPS